MSTPVQFAADNVVAPFKNATGLRSQANIIVSRSSETTDLSTLFGAIDQGHYLTLQADGGDVYVALGYDDDGSIDEITQGNNAGVCYPIPDGTEKSWRLFPVRVVPTGLPATYTTQHVLYTKVPTGAVATCYLRMHLSSLFPGQDASKFGDPT